MSKTKSQSSRQHAPVAVRIAWLRVLRAARSYAEAHQEHVDQLGDADALDELLAEGECELEGAVLDWATAKSAAAAPDWRMRAFHALLHSANHCNPSDPCEEGDDLCDRCLAVRAIAQPE